MLFRIIKRLIEKGVTDGLDEKVDVFYTLGKLTPDEYSELIGLLGNNNTETGANLVSGKDG